MKNRYTAKDILIIITVTLLVVFFVGSYIYLQSDSSICDTPFGARDYRCVGHFSR